MHFTAKPFHRVLQAHALDRPLQRENKQQTKRLSFHALNPNHTKEIEIKKTFHHRAVQLSTTFLNLNLSVRFNSTRRWFDHEHLIPTKSFLYSCTGFAYHLLCTASCTGSHHRHHCHVSPNRSQVNPTSGEVPVSFTVFSYFGVFALTVCEALERAPQPISLF